MQDSGLQSVDSAARSPAMAPSASPSVSVYLGQGYVVRATAERFSISRGLPLAVPSFDAITQPDVLRQVFAGAFQAASRYLDSTAHHAETTAPPTLMSYVYGLLGAYQTARVTPPIMMALSARYAACGRLAVVERCLTIASEESGHDTLALRDLVALGYPAAALVMAIRPKRALAMIDLLFRYAAAKDPIASFGYAYALERSAAVISEVQLRHLDSIIPAGITADRCVRVHGAAGGAAGHLRDSLDFMVTLKAHEQAGIAQGVFETLCVMHDPDLEDYPGDDALAAWIARIP